MDSFSVEGRDMLQYYFHLAAGIGFHELSRGTVSERLRWYHENGRYECRKEGHRGFVAVCHLMSFVPGVFLNVVELRR